MGRPGTAALLLSVLAAAPAAAAAEGVLDSMACIARAVYWEARDQPFEGQLGVAFVVLNRMRAGGRSACAVVEEAGGFSAIRSHRRERAREAGAWRLAQEVALLAWQDADADPTGAATHFHRADAAPAWSQALTLTRRIGAHLFFRARREVRAAQPAAAKATRLASPRR